MTKLLNLATYALLGLGNFLAQAQTHNSAECVSQGETIYTVGEDHVKPPNVQVVNSVGNYANGGRHQPLRSNPDGVMSEMGVFTNSPRCKLWNDESSHTLGKDSGLPEVD